MIAPTQPQPKLTELQCLYLTALRDGKRTGKQMRGRLRRWGVRGSNNAFYRVVKRLKQRALIKSEHLRKADDDYRGQEYYYELTSAGDEVAGTKLELLKSGATRRMNEAFRREIERVRACLG